MKVGQVKLAAVAAAVVANRQGQARACKQKYKRTAGGLPSKQAPAVKVGEGPTQAGNLDP